MAAAQLPVILDAFEYSDLQFLAGLMKLMHDLAVVSVCLRGARISSREEMLVRGWETKNGARESMLSHDETLAHSPGTERWYNLYCPTVRRST